MQKLSKEMLLKSLAFNAFFPREVPRPKDLPLKASLEFDENSDIFIAENLDDITLARRYSQKFILYKAPKIDELSLIEAGIYGADGILLTQSMSKLKSKAKFTFFKNLSLQKECKLIKNMGFSLAITAKNNSELLSASLLAADLVICNLAISQNLGKNKPFAIL